MALCGNVMQQNSDFRELLIITCYGTVTLFAVVKIWWLAAKSRKISTHASLLWVALNLPDNLKG
jgi:hypothetical protein